MDREKVINALECCIDGMLCAECDYEGIDRCFDKVLLTDVLALLQEQEAKIRQLRLALDIARGTCNGIKVEGR